MCGCSHVLNLLGGYRGFEQFLVYRAYTALDGNCVGDRSGAVSLHY